MKGFTLIEAMVAAAIVTLAVAGPFYAAERALVSALSASDRLTASYLAQEGIEYVQAMRDDTFLDDFRQGKNDLSYTAFDDFINGGSASSVTTCRGAGDGSTKCSLDPALPMGTGDNLSLQVCGQACGSFTLAAGGTAFKREIRFYDVGFSEEVQVKVIWSSHGAQSTITTVDYLSPWQ